MDRPSDERILALKAQFPDRTLHLVEVLDEGDDALRCFVMTSPSSDEHKMYTERMLEAGEAKDEKDKQAKGKQAIYAAALAQIRWPERDEVRKIFEYSPDLVWKFADLLQKHAGSGLELRSKKL